MQNELGVTPAFPLRPGRITTPGFHQLHHDLAVSRVAVAAELFSRGQGTYKLLETRLSFEIAGQQAFKKARGAAIPDLWLLFEGAKGRTHPLLFEIDRGTEYREKFEAHVLSRVDFIERGDYERIFQTPAVGICYLALDKPGRREQLLTWTGLLLKARGLTEWADVFRFAGVLRFGEWTEKHIFNAPIWYEPLSDAPPALPFFLLIGSHKTTVY